MSELKPCPFCGSDDVVVIHDCHVREGEEYASVTCRGCGVFAMALGHGSTPDEAMEDAKEKWNRCVYERDRVASSNLVAGMMRCLLVLLIVATCLIALGILNDAVHRENDCQEAGADSSVLAEDRASCPSCGTETWAVNGEIVCRNDDCESYGLPAKVQLT